MSRTADVRRGAGDPVAADPPGLVERGPLLVELSGWFADAMAGRGRVVFVGGEAGAGKTSLLGRFAAIVASGADVLVGRCDPAPTAAPLGPLLDVVALLPGAPVRTGAGGDTLGRDLLAALGSTNRPLVLAFEDLHWADQATLELVGFVARRIDGRRALLVATYRDDETIDGHPLRRLLGELATAPAVRRLSVPPLGVEGVRALAAGTGLDAEALLRATGGNAFFVTELIAARDLRATASVRDAVLSRAAGLSAPARALLEAVAVVGPRGEPWLVERLAGDGASAMHAILASGMLVEGSGAIAFRHELARDAVLGAIVPTRATALHRAALAALAAGPHGPADAARLAHHAEAAGDAPAALAHAACAARHAASLGAHREAAAQYARALRFAAGSPDEARAPLLEGFATACGHVDRHDDAIGALRELAGIARSRGDRLGEGGARTRLAAHLVATGRNPAAEAACRAAIGLLEPLPEGRALAEAYAQQAALRMLDRDLDEAIDWAGRALAIATRGGFEDTRLRASNRLGSALLLRQDPRGAARLEDDVVSAEHAGWPEFAALGYANLASGLGELMELDRAERWAREGAEYATARGLDGHAAYLRAWHAMVAMHRGRWADAESLAGTVLDRPWVAGITRIVASVALGRSLARRGDPRATDVLDRALGLAAPTGTLQRIAPVRIARAEAASLAGDDDAARREVRAVLGLALEKRHPWFAGALCEHLMRAGEPGPVPAWVAAPHGHALAGRWRDAAAEWEARGCTYEAAAVRAASDEPDALRDALAAFESLGARPAADRAIRRLRALGVRGLPRGPRGAARARPAGLTDREMDVLRCVARGLRDAEVARVLGLSTKTVGHHVSNVLSKLGVRSRTGAAAQARRLGLLPDGDASDAPT